MPYERSGGKQCVVMGCKNSQKKLYEWTYGVCKEHNVQHKDCPCLKPFNFHCVPRGEDMRKAWIKSINRKDFKPASVSLVCSLHFLDGRPTKQNPVPVVNMGYRKPPKQKRLVPTCKENIVDAAYEIEVVNDIDHQAPEQLVCAGAADDQTTTDTSTADQCIVVHACCHSHPELCKKQFVDTSTQTQDLVTSMPTQDLVVLDHSYSYYCFPHYKEVGQKYR